MEEKEREARTREEKRRRALARELCEDFAARQEARKSLERGWRLNLNFVSGTQYCDISPSGDIEEEDAAFYWQSRGCYNHIAPTIDTRMARLAKVRPSLNVRAFSDSEEDMKTARLCSNILTSVKTASTSTRSSPAPRCGRKRAARRSTRSCGISTTEILSGRMNRGIPYGRGT